MLVYARAVTSSPATRRADPAAASLPSAPIPRVGGPAQAAHRTQVERYLAHLRQLLGGDDDATRERATVTLSAMVAAVTVRRALWPAPRSDEILRDVREAVRERRLL